MEIEETVDGRFMVLVDGLQWGPMGSPRDGSGAAYITYATKAEAISAFNAEEEEEE